MAEGATKAEEARLAAIAEREEELRRAEEERLAAVALAAEKSRAEEQRRLELEEREERLRIAEEERLAAIALAEEKSRAEADRRAELEDREERLRIAEEERLAAIALAEGATKAEEVRQAITEEREDRLRLANERHRAELKEREERLRIAEEGRLAAIALAGERAQTEEQHRLAMEEQEARLRIAEEERLRAIALAEEIAKAEEKRRIELAEREERLRIVEAERVAALARAEEERLAARALADEKARVEEQQRIELEDREARLRIAEEDRLAVIARAEEDRRAAEARAEESARVDELRRLELEERAEQLRLSEEARLAALAQAEEARARAEAALAEAEAARAAREFEREERAAAEEREREAKSALLDAGDDSGETPKGRPKANGRTRSNGKSKSSKPLRAPLLGRGAPPTRREQRRRRPKTTSATSTQAPQAYAAPRLARIDGVPSEGMDIHLPLQPAVTVVESPADVPSRTGTITPDPGLVLPTSAHTRRRTTGRSASSSSHYGPLYGGGPSAAGDPGPLALPPNLRARRSQLLDRRPVEDSPSRLRTVGLTAFGGSILMLAGLMATGNATRVGVWMTQTVEESPLTGWVMGIVRPGSQIEPPAIDPTLGDYPGASTVVASVANSFNTDLNTLAANLDVANGPPNAWLTPEYISRPTSFVDVGEYFRRLGDYAVDGPQLMPSLADADRTFRSGFAAAGLSSESLAQQAMSVYVGLQSAWNDHLAAQRTFAELGAQFDQFLRQHEGTLTFMLGEFGHRSAAVATEASRLRVELGQAYERVQMTRTIVENRMIDLTMSE